MIDRTFPTEVALLLPIVVFDWGGSINKGCFEDMLLRTYVLPPLVKEKKVHSVFDLDWCKDERVYLFIY